ncbi:hypothetical protein [Bradyrhizobium sp. USDA 3256]
MTIGAGANESVSQAVAHPEYWAVAGHDYANTRFSPLKQINSDNVAKLSLVYSFSLGSLRSNESSPVVIGNTALCHVVMGTEVRLCARCYDWISQMDV